MPIVTPRVDAVERSANTTPIATNAAAMNGVPMPMTTAGQRNPFKWPSTSIAIDHTIPPKKTIGQRCDILSTRRPAGILDVPFTTA